MKKVIYASLGLLLFSGVSLADSGDAGAVPLGGLGHGSAIASDGTGTLKIKSGTLSSKVSRYVVSCFLSTQQPLSSGASGYTMTVSAQFGSAGSPSTSLESVLVNQYHYPGQGGNSISFAAHSEKNRLELFYIDASVSSITFENLVDSPVDIERCVAIPQ